MRTPEALTQAIRLYQESASADVKAYFELHDDGSFTSDTIMAEAQKRDKQKGTEGNRCLLISDRTIRNLA